MSAVLRPGSGATTRVIKAGTGRSAPRRQFHRGLAVRMLGIGLGGLLLVSASLWLNKSDLHAYRMTLDVRRGGAEVEYRLIEGGFERRRAEEVPPAAYQVETRTNAPPPISPPPVADVLDGPRAATRADRVVEGPPSLAPAVSTIVGMPSTRITVSASGAAVKPTRQ